MTAQRETKHRDDLAAARTAELAAQAQRDDDVRQLAQDLAIHQDAQGKANEIAAVDAERAKVVEEQEQKLQAAARASKSPAKTGVNAGPIPASCSEYSGNRAIGCALLLQKGFGLDQMPCLDRLWTKESGWNHLARNRNTGAYGIPQAYPGSKMASYGSDWETNPATQIAWGLGYIKGTARYKTPCGAWEYFQANNTY